MDVSSSSGGPVMNWLNALALLVLSAGHTELLVTVVNRLHGLPVPSGILRHVRHAHDVLVPLFPVVLVWFVGLTGPRLLLDGNWSHLPDAWRAYLAVCGLGAAGLGYSSARYLLCRAPDQVISENMHVVDVADALGRRPIGKGPFRWLLGVPGNQQFDVAVATKEVSISDAPPELDGLSIWHLSDWHFFGAVDLPYFAYVAQLVAQHPADLIVFTGDLLDRQELTAWIPETLGTLSAPLGCHFILGNHDWSLDPEPIRTALRRCGWQDAARRVVTVGHRGGRIEIGGTERPWMGEHPDFRGARHATQDGASSRALRLLLSHTPDCLGEARRQNVDLMLAGHNHGGQVVLPAIGPVYSPSLSGCRYSGGTYWKSPTLLHVSRGLSGRHPLRINCRPEIARLILRTQPEAARP
jgi:predicted MPP superfamily phosphohydrolase